MNKKFNFNDNMDKVFTFPFYVREGDELINK